MIPELVNSSGRLRRATHSWLFPQQQTWGWVGVCLSRPYPNSVPKFPVELACFQLAAYAGHLLSQGSSGQMSDNEDEKTAGQLKIKGGRQGRHSPFSDQMLVFRAVLKCIISAHDDEMGKTNEARLNNAINALLGTKPKMGPGNKDDDELMELIAFDYSVETSWKNRKNVSTPRL